MHATPGIHAPLTESALVKQLLDVVLPSSVVDQLPAVEERAKRYARLSVRSAFIA